MTSLRIEHIVFAAWAFAMGALLVLIATLCDGHIIFTLDDPYIHLAVAHNILHGTYGVNAGEYASPSSSILWPWLLALTEATGLKAAGPLLLNLLAAGGSVFVIIRFLNRERLLTRERTFFSATLITTALLATSALALPLTGMEHSAHVLVTLLATIGLLAAARGQKPTALFIAAIILMPLLRFEGMAYALACIVALWALGYRRYALATLGLLAGCIGIYAVYMGYHHLPLLPGSILLKSGVARSAYAPGEMIAALFQTFWRGLQTIPGASLFIASLVIITMLVDAQKDRRIAIALSAILVAIWAHMLGGAFGGFFRYEIYAVVLAFTGLCIGMKRGNYEPKLQASIALLALGLAAPYAIALWQTPSAAQNIYQQQYQMARFAQDYYRQPVAVNDLGLVSYGNDHFVLDLYGLGSEPVRRMKMANMFMPPLMAGIVTYNHIGLIMIYRSWFSALPASWQKIAVLYTPQVTAASGDVTFFTNELSDRAAIRRMLEEFQPTLPAGDTLEIEP